MPQYGFRSTDHRLGDGNSDGQDGVTCPQPQEATTAGSRLPRPEQGEEESHLWTVSFSETSQWQRKERGCPLVAMHLFRPSQTSKSFDIFQQTSLNIFCCVPQAEIYMTTQVCMCVDIKSNKSLLKTIMLILTTCNVMQKCVDIFYFIFNMHHNLLS